MDADIEPTVSTRTLADRIARRLRLDILSGRYEPEERLPAERKIAASFDASLSTVRGALRQLVSEGLVSSKRGPRGGYFVGRPSVENTGRIVGSAIDWLVMSGLVSDIDVLEAHQAISVACCRLAAQRRSDMDMIQIEQAIIKMGDSSLPNDLFRASEVQFLRLIASAGGNPLLKLLNHFTSRAFAAATRGRVFSFENRQAIAENGRHLVSAIRARQAHAVDERMSLYFECFRNSRTDLGLITAVGFERLSRPR